MHKKNRSGSARQQTIFRRFPHMYVYGLFNIPMCLFAFINMYVLRKKKVHVQISIDYTFKKNDWRHKTIIHIIPLSEKKSLKEKRPIWRRKTTESSFP